MRKYIYIILISGIFFTGCTDMLDIKPVNSMIPKSVADFEAVLMGGYPRTEFFMKTELRTDNVYANMNTGREADKKLVPWFSWADSHQTGDDEIDPYWNQLYKSVFYANTIIDEFKNRKPEAEEKERYEIVYGEAYALRAYAYFYLVNLYAENYCEENLQKLGVPMPLSAENVHNNTQNNVRKTVETVWNQILSDIADAEKYLAGKPHQNKFRFDYFNVQMLKSRVALYMDNMEDVITSTSMVLGAKQLINMDVLQNVVDEDGHRYAFGGDFGVIETDYEKEVMFYTGGKGNGNMYYYPQTIFKPTYELLDFFVSDTAVLDYRRYIFDGFFDPDQTEDIKQGRTVYEMYGFQGEASYYIGFKVSEAVVSRAEAYARKGEKQKAIDDLNYLLKNRIKDEDFKALTLSDFNDDAAKILERALLERRKELAFEGGLRWFDLRRLGKPAMSHIFENGVEYSIEKGDLNYVLQIPVSEMKNSPNMPINPR